MTIQIIVNDKGNPPGKLADAEVHFTEGALAGLKLIGFGVWSTSRGRDRAVTFPARSYSVSGERRTFALLRPTGIDGPAAQDRVKALILEAYAEYEDREQTAAATDPATDNARAEAVVQNFRENFKAPEPLPAVMKAGRGRRR
jgi:hypothetical protein